MINKKKNAALTAFENKVPNMRSLVKKTGYNSKITEIEKKITDHNHYINTPEFNTLAADVFNARLAQGDLITRLILTLNCQVLTKKLPQIKQSIYLLKMN